MSTNTLTEDRSTRQVLRRGLRELRWSGIVVECGFIAVAAVVGGWAVSRAAVATAAAYSGQPLGGVPFMGLGIAAVVILAALLLLVEVHSWGARDDKFGVTLVVAGSAAAALATGVITFLSMTWFFTVQLPALVDYFTGAPAGRRRSRPEPWNRAGATRRRPGGRRGRLVVVLDTQAHRRGRKALRASPRAEPRRVQGAVSNLAAPHSGGRDRQGARSSHMRPISTHSAGGCRRRP